MNATTRSVDWTWVLLISLTLVGVTLGEGAEPGLWVTALIAAITGFKGRLVIDSFMELGGAHPGIRRLVRLYGLLVPILMIAVFLFGPQIAGLTSL